MTNLQNIPKPTPEITDYEWNVTPLSVKVTIDNSQQLLKQKQQIIEGLQQENKWLREQLDLRLDKPNRAYQPPLPEILLWGAIGLILTVGGTFIPAYSLAAPWSWWSDGLSVQTLGVSYQIGAVLLIACLGGKNAALLSQTAYILLGLAGLPVFDRGGGLAYLQQPSFGYLLGFVVGSWVCGWLAFQTLVRFSSLIASCLVGLVVIHLIGLTYTLGIYLAGWSTEISSVMEGIVVYSLQPLPGQLAVVCAVSLIGFATRKLMFS